MKIPSLVRAGAFVLWGAVALTGSQSARADVPPLDFPAACLPLLQGQVLYSPPQQSWTGEILLPIDAQHERLEEFSIWRVECGDGSTALQMRLAPLWPDPLFDPHVSLPALSARQHGQEYSLSALRVSYPDSTSAPTRIAPGTSNASPGMFVLTSSGSGADLNQVLSLVIRHPFKQGVAQTVNIPAYAPSASVPLPLSGRLVGNFYDPAKSGEGILVEIVDTAEPELHALQFSWFTYDTAGHPFWISGGGNFHDGDTHVHMPALFRGGGRFAGGKGASESTPWGTVDMEFPDCHTLRLGYSTSPSLPAPVPGGSGQLEWRRLTSVSGYRCD